MAWPGFAYSIEDEDEAKATYAFVLTYLVALASWAALGLGLLAPWLVQLLAPTNEAFWPGERVVAPPRSPRRSSPGSSSYRSGSVVRGVPASTGS